MTAQNRNKPIYTISNKLIYIQQINQIIFEIYTFTIKSKSNIKIFKIPQIKLIKSIFF